MRTHVLETKQRLDDPGAYFPIQLGRIIAVDPITHTVTAATARRGIIRNAAVVYPGAGFMEGWHSLPTPTLSKNARNTDDATILTDTFLGPKTQDTYGIFVFVNDTQENVHRGRPYCIGFVHPPYNQLALDDASLWLFRHNSDMYMVIDGLGNFAMEFPDGTYFRVGASATMIDIASKVSTLVATSRPWTIVESNPGVTRLVEIGLGTGEKVHIEHNLIEADIDVNTHAKLQPNAIELKATTVTVTGDLHVTGNTDIDGNLNVDGHTDSVGVIKEGGTPVSLGSPLGVGHTHP